MCEAKPLLYGMEQESKSLLVIWKRKRSSEVKNEGGITMELVEKFQWETMESFPNFSQEAVDISWRASMDGSIGLLLDNEGYVLSGLTMMLRDHWWYWYYIKEENKDQKMVQNIF